MMASAIALGGMTVSTGPIGLPGTEPGVVDLPVDDHMHDVYPFRVKLARERLAEHAQSRLADGQGREAGAATQRGGGAGERDETMAGLEHVRDHRLRQINGAHHVRVEGLADLLGIHFQKIWRGRNRWRYGPMP